MSSIFMAMDQKLCNGSLTAREALDVIDDMLISMSQTEGKDLLTVLSALRGPDLIAIGGTDEKNIKAVSWNHQRARAAKNVLTAVIREKALPRTACSILPGYMIARSDDAEAMGKRRRMLQQPKSGKHTAFARRNYHFVEHAEGAFRVLFKSRFYPVPVKDIDK